MRLLFALPHFPPSKFGGVASSMFLVVDGFKQYDFEIKVLTTNNKLPKSCEYPNNKWISFNGLFANYINTRFPAISFRFITEGIRQIFHVEQVHLSGLFFFPNLIFVIFSLLQGKKVILSPHGELQKPALHYKYWKKWPYLQTIRFFFKKVIFRATSKEEAIEIRRFFPKNEVVIIPNYINFSPPLNKNKLNQILFLGRVCKIKRIENLILACSTSDLFRTTDYQLIIAGPTDSELEYYARTLLDFIESVKLQNKNKKI